jgi:P4 family phage/plasmid primase-like protien
MDFNITIEKSRLAEISRIRDQKILSQIARYAENEILVQGKTMAALTDFSQPSRGMYWIWSHGHWRKTNYFIVKLQKRIHTLVKQLERATRLELDYLRVSKNLLTKKILPQTKLYEPFDFEKYIDTQTVPVFCKNKVVLITPNGTEEKLPDASNGNFWSLAVEPEDTPTPNFNTFLDFITCNDNELKGVIQELMGYCITPLHLRPSFFFLVGHGRNGKTLLQNVIKRIVGHKSTANLPLESLNDVTIERLADALVNIPSESQPGKFNEDLLKTLSGGESRDCNPKYRDAYTVKPVAKLIFALNRLPVTTDLSHGFWERAQIIPFKNTVQEGQEDPFYLRRFKDEWQGIANFAIKGLVRLVQQSGYYSKCKIIEDERKKYRTETSAIFLFIEELIGNFEHFKSEFSAKAKIKNIGDDLLVNVTADFFYEQYVKFAQQNGHHRLSKKEMLRRVEEARDNRIRITRQGNGIAIEIYISVCNREPKNCMYAEGKKDALGKTDAYYFCNFNHAVCKAA